MNQELYDNALWLIDAIARGLEGGASEGVGDVLGRLARQRLDQASFREPESTTLPVLRHLPQAIGETMLVAPDAAAAIAAVEDALQWRQSVAYSDAVLGDGFIANYGWAQIIGPHGFFAGDDFLLGLLMLGPERHYRDHYHPAAELYWPLTSASLWSRGSGTFVEKPQGATIWHPPMTVHATKTQGTPLLAVWCWTHDTATPATLAS